MDLIHRHRSSCTSRSIHPQWKSRQSIEGNSFTLQRGPMGSLLTESSQEQFWVLYLHPLPGCLHPICELQLLALWPLVDHGQGWLSLLLPCTRLIFLHWGPQPGWVLPVEWIMLHSCLLFLWVCHTMAPTSQRAKEVCHCNKWIRLSFFLLAFFENRLQVPP